MATKSTTKSEVEEVAAEEIEETTEGKSVQSEFVTGIQNALAEAFFANDGESFKLMWDQIVTFSEDFRLLRLITDDLTQKQAPLFGFDQISCFPRINAVRGRAAATKKEKTEAEKLAELKAKLVK